MNGFYDANHFGGGKLPLKHRPDGLSAFNRSLRHGLWLVAKESLVPIRVSVPACERPKDSTTKQPAALRNFSRLRRRIYVGGSRAAFAATLESRPVYPG